MPGALKKQLAKLSLQAGDLLLFHIPFDVPPTEYGGFVEALAVEAAEYGVGPVICVRPGAKIEAMNQAQLNALGLLRLVPPKVDDGVSIEQLEEEAHQQVRLAFGLMRAQIEERNAGRTTGDNS